MMNIPPPDPERRLQWQRQNQSTASASSPILPDELIAEVLSFLDVKSLLKIRCVCKSWKSLISDPNFVQLHLKRSKRNPQLALYTRDSNESASVVPFPICRLLENPLNTLSTDPCYQLMEKDYQYMVGFCNGLICLEGFYHTANYKATWFCLWNPATRKVSKKLGFFLDYSKDLSSFKYMFGYDNSTCTYKLVALHLVANPQTRFRLRTDVKVLSLGDNVWRFIQSFPFVPYVPDVDCGVDFRGSLNWLSLPNVIDTVIVEKFVINSFDLSTDTHKQFLPPPSLDASPYIVPHIRVLVDCLCFSYDVKRTHLLIWKMTEFGVQESWTQFLKISYQNIYIGYDFYDWKNDFNCRLAPLHLFENSNTLIFYNRQEDAAIFYNWRDNTVKETRTTQRTCWYFSKNYFESLVSPC